MGAEVFCFASSKGGSGKTILTASIASFLSGIGKKCLIIDCDAATHGLTLLYLVEVSEKKTGSQKGLFQISSSDNLQQCVEDSVIEVANSIDILPATYDFTPEFDPEETTDEESLFEIIKLMKPNYDYIFLDAQAGSDKFSRLAMKSNISDKVIIVSEYDPLSAAGIERLKQVVGSDLDYSRTWVLLNKMLPEFVEKFSEFLSIAKYLPPIPWNADIVRSYASRKLALDLENGNAFTLSIMRMVKALIGERIERDIVEWTESRAYALKEPLEQQYNDAEKEFDLLVKNKNKKNKKNKLIMYYKKSIIISFLLGIIFSISGYFDIFSLNSLVERLNTIKNDTGGVFLAVVFGGIVAVMPAMYTIIESFFDAADRVEDARYLRKKQMLEEKLNQLEALRASDFETIVNGKNI